MSLVLHLTFLFLQNSTCAEADKNLENLGIVSPHNIEEPISEILVTVSIFIHFGFLLFLYFLVSSLSCLMAYDTL